jgi:hypothetical protein
VIAVAAVLSIAGCADGTPALAPGAPDRVGPQMLPYPSVVSGVTLKVKDS